MFTRKIKNKTNNTTNTTNKPISNFKCKLVYRIPIISSLVLAIVITACVGFALEPYDAAQHNGYMTILDSPNLLHSLQVAKSDGVVMAIHGWMHEDYTNLTHSAASADLSNASRTFDAGKLHTTIFVSPYEISNISETQNTLKDIKDAGLTIPFNAATVYEYTWEWRDINSMGDPRYSAAVTKINKDQPHVLVLHAQDWNLITAQFMNDYLAHTQTSTIVRMDDIDCYTKPSVIQGMDNLRKYSSVSEVMLAVIPAIPLAKDTTTQSPFSLNKIMNVYLIFFLAVAMFPISFFVVWKLTAGATRRKYEKMLLETEIKYPDFLTIIIPAYNEEKSIARCIESMLRQDYKGAKEIIVVNDGSKDRTADIIPQYPVTFLNLKENGGKANALNAAINMAQGDIIVFSDGDSNMCPDAITSLVRCFSANPDADMVTGNVLINKPTGKNKLLTYCQMVEYHLEQEIARYLQGLNGNVLVCPGPITAVKRSICDEIMFSDSTIVEDADFTITALKKEHKVILDPYSKVYTNAPETLKQWYKQRKRWWYGNLQVWQQHKKWAIKNPWMVYNYISYLTSLCALVMMGIMPYLIIQSGDVPGSLMKGLFYLFVPVVIYIAMTAMFFWHDKKLILMLIPYMIIYPMMKMFVLSYIYLCYITGRGMSIQFGARKIKAK